MLGASLLWIEWVDWEREGSIIEDMIENRSQTMSSYSDYKNFAFYSIKGKKKSLRCFEWKSNMTWHFS